MRGACFSLEKASAAAAAIAQVEKTQGEQSAKQKRLGTQINLLGKTLCDNHAKLKKGAACFACACELRLQLGPTCALGSASRSRCRPRAPGCLHSAVRRLCVLTRCPALLHSAEATVAKLSCELENACATMSTQDSNYALLKKNSKKYLDAGARLRLLFCECITSRLPERISGSFD